jgi:hypothetical protein
LPPGAVADSILGSGQIARPVVRPVKAGAFSGSQSHRGKSQRPVAWMAGRRETDDLKPIDKAVLGTVSESPGRSASERIGGLDRRRTGGRALYWLAKAARHVADWLTRRVAPAGW